MSNDQSEKVARGLRAGEWHDIFRRVGVEKEQVEKAKGNRGRTTIIGNFLCRNINREVGIGVDDRNGKATLRKEEVRAGQTRYYFEIVWDEVQPAAADQPVEGSASGDEQQPATRTAAETAGPGPTPSRESAIDHSGGHGPTSAANDEAW